MFEHCLWIEKKKKDKSLWFLGSGCSKHLTNNFSKFSSFTKNDDGLVTFGDNAKGKIIGICNVGNSFPPIIEHVLLVYNLKLVHFKILICILILRWTKMHLAHLNFVVHFGLSSKYDSLGYCTRPKCTHLIFASSANACRIPLLNPSDVLLPT